MNKTALPACNFADRLDWNDLRYALAAARSGSQAATARTLGVDQTTVARRLRVLEKELGTPLFERLKGQMVLTAAGMVLVQRGQRIEHEIAALGHLAADTQALVQGVIRITAVDAIITHFLVRHLAGLRQRYPGLVVELVASSKALDLSRREADIALRLARPQSGDFVVRRIAELPYGVYGAADATAAADWENRNWVAYDHSLAHVPEMQWLAETVSEERIAFRCNNMDALASAVADGLGLGILPCLVGARHPSLVCLSGEKPLLTRGMWLVIPRELREVPRIRAVSDWLIDIFQADDNRDFC